MPRDGACRPGRSKRCGPDAEKSKPEHAVDLDTGAVVTVEMRLADQGGTAALPGTLESAARHPTAVGAAPSVETPAELGLTKVIIRARR